MPDLQVTCINKQDRYDPTERITHVGGTNWRKTTADAIRDIELRNNTFYVMVGRRVDVIVATSSKGNKYLKTVADGDTPNNLLSLPECR